MHFQNSHLLLLPFYIQMVYSQVTLFEIETGDKTPPFFCGNSLKLRCQYNGTSTCCMSFTRIWRQGTTALMNDGTEISTTGKYTETIDATAKYFELTIWNLHRSDFDKTYVCEYGFDKSDEKFIDGQFYCSPCWFCGVQCSLWSFFGTVLANAMLIVGIFIMILNDFGDNEGDKSDQIIIGPDNSGAYDCKYVLFLILDVVHTFEELKRTKRLLKDALKIVIASLFVGTLAGMTHGTLKCICYDFTDEAYHEHPSPSYIALGYLMVVGILLILALCQLYTELTCCEVAFLFSLLLFSYIPLFGYAVYICLKKKKVSQKIICLLILVVLTQGIILLVIIVLILQGADTGSVKVLKSPFKATDNNKIRWYKIDDNKPKLYSEGQQINPDLQLEIGSRLKVTGDHDLSISDVSMNDEGVYRCELSGTPDAASQVFSQHLTVKSGKNQSVESGSSCWPICRVGQDPNTSSSGPEKVRRSPEKERVDIKQDKKPTKVVRPQPSRPLPPLTQHLRTDNTGREEYSTEIGIYKPRLLPSIGDHSDSPRSLPKRTKEDQLQKGDMELKPVGDSTPDRKKRRKRKKKETKQSDEDD